jgi:hypothetical protein
MVNRKRSDSRSRHLYAQQHYQKQAAHQLLTCQPHVTADSTGANPHCTVVLLSFGLWSCLGDWVLHRSKADTDRPLSEGSVACQ